MTSHFQIQRCRQVFKFGGRGAISNVVGIICHPWLEWGYLNSHFQGGPAHPTHPLTTSLKLGLCCHTSCGRKLSEIQKIPKCAASFVFLKNRAFELCRSLNYKLARFHFFIGNVVFLHHCVLRTRIANVSILLNKVTTMSCLISSHINDAIIRRGF